MGDQNDSQQNINSQLLTSRDLWISRIAGGGIGGVLLAGLVISLPILSTIVADYKEVRILEIKAQAEQCQAQLNYCSSDLKQCRGNK